MEYITNGINLLTSILSRFSTMCKSFFEIFINFLSILLSIIQTLRFGLITLLSGIWSFIIEVLDGTLFGYVAKTFDYLINYLGFAGLFMSGFLFLILVRLIVAFIFKILRLNVDYHTLQSKTKRRRYEDMKKPLS